MTEVTHEEALRQADVLVGQALQETETRCALLGQFINQCEGRGPKPSAWSDALREFHALHDHRFRLLRRRSLIRQALDYSVGEGPARVPLPATPDRTNVRTQLQIQVQARRRRS
jgi:hypothetical protein